ncbi:hypothetical protein BU23DRAFT_483743, partial [Bimuria novae-zelandiae CBS 107.79]
MLSPNIRLLFTARDCYHGRYNLKEVMDIEYAPTDDDLKCYLRAQVQKHAAFNEALSMMKEDDIVGEIIPQARGMMLLAQLHISDVAARYTLADLRTALGNLPTNIKHTYEKAMQRIAPGEKPLAERVLMWLTFSMSPLTVNELKYALAVN